MTVRRWGSPVGSPVAMMVAATLFALLCAAAATGLAVLQPSLGLWLQAGDGEDGSVIVDVEHSRNGAAVAAAFGGRPAAPVRLAAIGPAGGDGGPLHPLTAEDVIPEPDVLPTYAVLADFFGRQSLYAGLLRRGPVILLLRDGTGAERRVTVTPDERRDVGTLPPVFWFQVAVGVVGLLMSLWVWALRPGDRGARLFALVGLSMPGFTLPAAVYSTRELALDGTLFRVLSDMNAAGAMTFGAAMIGVFLSYPRRIVGPVVLAAPFAVFGAWLLAHLLRLPEGHGDGAHLPTLLEMLCIVGAIAAQWWATRRDPVGRAALSWLGLSVVVGAGAFVTLMSVPMLTGTEAPIPQGYAFGFFLLIHAGLTLGLRRYRLFELGDWAFRVMLAALGLVALLLLDMVLVAALQFDQNLALGLSLLAVGFLYLPLRDVLMRRLVGTRTIPDHELFAAVIAVAFTATPERRVAAWSGLLRRLFDPLEMEPAAVPVPRPVVAGDGVVLEMPPTAGAPGLRLRYPWGGRGLFTPAQLSMATRLCELMARAESGREAYVRGAAAERQRIARDLHDDLGARLLSALHQPDLDRSRGMVREAMADVRTIVRGLSGERQPLGQVLGDLRHETVQRLEGTGITLRWPVAAEPDPAEDLPLDYATCRTLTATVREAVSNAIRHAGATALDVSVDVSGGRVTVAVTDDGTGFGPARTAGPAGAGGGFGLGNMVVRAAELGGRLDITATERGTRMELSLALPGTAP